MSQLPQQLVNGLFIGSVYSLFALGYTLIFGVLDILNLAHAAVFSLGALSSLWFMQHAGAPLWLAFPAAVLLSGLLGIVIDRVAFAPLRGRPDTHFSGLISSLAMAAIFEAVALGLFGAHTTGYPQGTLPVVTWQVGDVIVTSAQVAIVVVAVALMAALTAFLRFTRTGMAIRAVASNERAAQLLGINVDRVVMLTFFISSALGGAAGVLFGLYFNSLSPDMGRAIELKGLAVIVVGGMSSIPGAVLGGLALGLSEVLTIAITGTSNLRDAVAFTVLFLILLLRPSGLLGRSRREA